MKMVKRRNNIVLVRRDSPKKVTFNGRSFNAHFRRVNRNYLPGSTKIARTYKGRPINIKKRKNKQPTYNAAIKKLPKWLVKADPNKPIVSTSTTQKNSYAAAVKRLPDWLVRAKPSANIKRPPWLQKRKQKGKGLSDVAKTVASNPYLKEVGRKIISKGINSIPSLFRKGTKKVNNKKLRRMLQSDIAIDLVNKATTRLHGGL